MWQEQTNEARFASLLQQQGLLQPEPEPEQEAPGHDVDQLLVEFVQLKQEAARLRQTNQAVRARLATLEPRALAALGPQQQIKGVGVIVSRKSKPRVAPLTKSVRQGLLEQFFLQLVLSGINLSDYRDAPGEIVTSLAQKLASVLDNRQTRQLPPTEYVSVRHARKGPE